MHGRLVGCTRREFPDRSTVPYDDHSKFPFDRGQKLGLLAMVVQLVEQSKAFSFVHVFDARGECWIDEERLSTTHRVVDHNWMSRFLNITTGYRVCMDRTERFQRPLRAAAQRVECGVRVGKDGRCPTGWNLSSDLDRSEWWAQGIASIGVPDPLCALAPWFRG